MITKIHNAGIVEQLVYKMGVNRILFNRLNGFIPETTRRGDTKMYQTRHNITYMVFGMWPFVGDQLLNEYLNYI